MGESLTSKARLRMALSHEQTDRVPLDLGGTTVSTVSMTAYVDLKKELNINKESYGISKIGRYAMVDEEVLKSLSIDTRMLLATEPISWDSFSLKEEVLVDDWGVEYECPEGTYYYSIRKSPLKDASVRDIENYTSPKLLSSAQVGKLIERRDAVLAKGDYGIVGNLPGASLFELATYLRGFSEILIDMMENKKHFHAIMEKLIDIQEKRFRQFLDIVGDVIDVVFVASDVAMQTSSIMSPESYREMIKPYQKRYFDYIKSRTKAKLLYHTCGNVFSLIKDFIDIGVDALNPVQVSARDMVTSELKRRYGRNISYWGAIDTGHVLPKGSAQDVRDEVDRRIGDLFHDGGYVLAPVHTIQPDVPARNIIEMYRRAAQVSARVVAR